MGTLGTNKELSELKMKMIEGILKNDTITQIAKDIKVTRNTVYAWLELDDVKAELNKRKQQIISKAQNAIMNDMDKYIAEVKRLALESDSDKIKTDCLIYLIDKTLGKNTTKIQEISDENNNNNQTNEQIMNELNDFKLIELEKKAK
ncbi:IS630 transposase-related protein [Clostridium grantii]|uniref:Transposase n=1 Tax=Clostridium grantii DSM 8605 TaxID=1121316 RepID=A0A1M5SDP3_9CLOT|nr:IS630 transposase-related protein [Clostridium grantii]SHH36408.1 Transposase [Clostridium grantii DSM 8605]